MVGMWTDTPKSFDVLHDAFNKADVQGYLGGFVLSEAMGQSDYAQFLSSTLCLPPNIILCDGSKGGNNKYMV